MILIIIFFSCTYIFQWKFTLFNILFFVGADVFSMSSLLLLLFFFSTVNHGLRCVHKTYNVYNNRQENAAML